MLKTLVACLIVPAVVVLMGFVLVALSSPERQDGAPPPLAAGVKVMSIPASAFTQEFGVDTNFYNYGEITNYSGQWRYFDAPIILPHGSRILRIGFTCFDNGGEDISMFLNYTNDDGSIYKKHFNISSQWTSVSYRKIISAVRPLNVTTLSRSYFLELELPPGSASYRLLRAFVYYRDAP